jgi:hypothetical protein
MEKYEFIGHEHLTNLLIFAGKPTTYALAEIIRCQGNHAEYGSGAEKANFDSAVSEKRRL